MVDAIRVQSVTADKDTSLNVLSQNVYGVPTACDRRERLDRLIDQINDDSNNDYFDADFVAFQEVFTRASRKFVTASVEHPYFSIPQKRGFFKLANSGLAALSRFPIIKEEFHPFATARGVDGLAEKGVLLTRLLHPVLGEVDFYTLHMQASYSDSKKFELTRDCQIKEVFEFVGSQSGDRTVILTGDFNMRENQQAYHSVIGAGFTDVMREMHPDAVLTTRRAQNPYVNDEDRDVRLDYVFVRPGDDWEWNRETSVAHIMTSCDAQREPVDACWGDTAVSDHYGIFTKINFRRKTME